MTGGGSTVGKSVWLANSIETWTEALKEAGDLPVMIENIFEEDPPKLSSPSSTTSKGRTFGSVSIRGISTSSRPCPSTDWLVPLKDRLMEFHIHDNHGKSDEHLPVGKGLFPFRELKRFIRSLTGIYFTAETASEAAALETIQCAKEFLS